MLANHDFLIIFEGFNNISRKCNDTALISKGKRRWSQKEFGIIKNWTDFEKSPWEKIGLLLGDYVNHLDFISSVVLVGMGVGVVGAIPA